MKRFHSILCAAFAALLCLSCMACGTPQNAATEAVPTAAATLTASAPFRSGTAFKSAEGILERSRLRSAAADAAIPKTTEG